MVREWQMWQDWGRDRTDHRLASSEGPVKVDRYNPRWVPITWDGGTVNLCIDLDPAPVGVQGQVIYLNHLDPQCVAAEGWRAFLERYAAALGAGQLRFEANELVAG